MKLSNGIITVEVAPHGAELVSLVKGRREYMWCGDAQYWNRHAPILFPAVASRSTTRSALKARRLR